MKEKGIYNEYKGFVRPEIQTYCREHHIEENEFHFINIYKWESVYYKVMENFFEESEKNKRRCWWKLHWSNTNGGLLPAETCFDSRGCYEWILKIPELIKEKDKMVYLLLDEGISAGREKFWIAEGNTTIIAELLYEEVHCGCDYYIVDKKYNWLITCNHHDIIQFVGKGLEIKKIEDMIMQRKG